MDNAYSEPGQTASDKRGYDRSQPETFDNHVARTMTSQSSVARPKSLVQEALFVAVICLAQFMTQAGLAQAIVFLNIIGRSFNATNPGQLSWYAAAYSLTVGTFILVAGRLGDMYGHRLMFIIGFAWFGLWSFLAGFAVWSNQILFDCCRAFQGIGPALLLPNALAIPARTYEPGPRKDMIFSIFGASAPAGYVVGGVFASIFAELAWWPWSFWVTGIACFCFAALGILVIPRTPPPNLLKEVSWLSQLDALGATSGITALILINFAWN